MSNIAITNLTKRPAPDWPFVQYKEKILGRTYDLSLVFCGPTKARQLNLIYRHKDKEANILSFPLSKTAGEIFINLPAGRQDALSKDGFSVPHLFIHGLLHLKGLSHGSKMDSEERKYLKLFGIQPVQ